MVLSHPEDAVVRRRRQERGFAISSIPRFYFWAVFSALVAYLVRIYLARTLGPEQYGTLFALMGFIGILLVANDLGFSSAAVYHTIRARVGARKTLNFSAYFWLKTGVALTLTVLLILFAEPVTDSYMGDPTLVTLVRLSALIFIGDALLSVISTYAAVFGNTTLYASLGHLRQASWFALVVLAPIFFPGTDQLTMAFFAWIASYFVTLSWSLFAVPWRRIVVRLQDLRDVKKHLVYAYSVFLSSISGLVITRTDVVIINTFRGPLDVGLYEVALPLASIILTPFEPFLVFLGPALVHVFSQGNVRSVFDLIQTVYDLIPFVIVPFMVFVAIFSKEIIAVLFGTAYVAAAPVLVILCIAMAFRIVYSINVSILIARGAVRVQQRIMVFGAVVNVALSIPAVIMFGVSGAAFASLLVFAAMTFASLRALRPFVRFRIPFAETAWCSLTALAAGYLSFLVKTALILNSILEAIVVGTVFVAVYVATTALVLYCFFPSVIPRLKTQFRGLLR
jgi:O-antigen/teichoic acid export membrane protein